jgi:flagellar hook-associated protein 2
MAISFNLSPNSATQGQGIDVTAVVDQILAAEGAPEQLLKQQITQLSAQTSALNGLNSGLAALQSAVNALADVTGAITGKVAVSSQPATLSANVDSSAVAGVHTLVVTNLASTSSYFSSPLTDGDTQFAQGAFQLKVGAAAPVSITVDGTNNTLTGLAAAINLQNLGVTASVVTDANGARLALLSQSTGSPGDLTVSANTTGISFTKAADGLNATLTVDGVPISSTSNTVTGVLAGVTLHLISAAPGANVALSISPNRSGAQAAVQNFVSAYNALIVSVNNQFRFDATTGAAGALAANSDLRRLQTQLLEGVTYSIAGNNGFGSLAAIGVNFTSDGTLAIDDTKLTDVINNHFSDFQSFFQSLGPSSFAKNFAGTLNALADSTEGLLNLDLQENQNNQRAIQKSIDTLDDRLAARRLILIAQYSRVDAQLRQFPLLQAQITGQLSSLSNFSK